MTVPQIKVRVVRRPLIKVKALVKFPANVVANKFLTVTNSGGTYTFDVDYTRLSPGPISDPTTAYAAVLDQTSGLYRFVALSSLLTSGLDADLQAIAALTGTGVLVRTAANTWTFRTITGTAAEVTVTNGDGVAGVPTLSLPTALTFTGKTITGGTFNSPALVTPTLGVATGTTLALSSTTNPQLTVANPSTDGATIQVQGTTHQVQINETGGGGGLKTVSAGELTFGTNNTTRFHISSAGGFYGEGATGTDQGIGTVNLASPASLYSNGTAPTGTGAYVRATSPTLVTPALGTPTALVATNATGTAAGLTAGNATLAATVTTNANLTGPVTSVGNATTIGANQVTRAMEAQGIARSVIGVTGNVTANVADIQGTASQFLVVNSAGTALAFTSMTGDAALSGGGITIANNAISNAKMSTMAAFTFKGNNTGSAAVPTDVDIAALTSKASPAAGDFVILSDQAASGAWKRATVSSIASAGSVSSIAGNTGAFTLSTGITNSANDIRLASNAAFSATLGGANQTGVVSSTPTKITFNTKVYDIGTLFSTANNRWTPPAGTVHMSAAMLVSGTWAVNSTTSIYVYKNGSPLVQSVTTSIANQGNGVISVDDRANGTDFYEVWLNQATTSGTVTVLGNTGPCFTFFTGHWVCP